jgi:hypothetical protein
LEGLGGFKLGLVLGQLMEKFLELGGFLGGLLL